MAFAQLHGLKIGTIADLIAHRRRTERQVERVLETPFNSTYGGRFRMVIYRNSIDQTEHVVLTKGRIDAGEADPGADAPRGPGHRHAGRGGDPAGVCAARALKALADYDGAAVAVLIRDSNPHWLSERYGQGQANHSENILRDYGIGAQILTDLGVRDMLLLTSSQTVLPGSAGYGLRIVGRVPLD